MSKEGPIIKQSSSPEFISETSRTSRIKLELFRFADRLSISQDKVLNLGSGLGEESFILAELGFNVTALDNSSEKIREARQLKAIENPPSFVEGDMRGLGKLFKKDFFDAVWAPSSLSHISKEDASGFFDAIHNVTKDHGTVFVGSGMLTELTESEVEEWKEDVASLIKEKGFEIEEFSEDTSDDEESESSLNFFLTVKK